MGSYAYCEKCECGLPGPWEFPIEILVKGAIDFELLLDDLVCKVCNTPYWDHHAYTSSRFAEELAERLQDLTDRLEALESKLKEK